MPYVNIDWMRDFADAPADLTAEQLAFDLVKVGLEEESILSSGVTGPLVLGRVVKITPEKQSNGKTINYCRVDVGVHNESTPEGDDPDFLPDTRGIICGAHNFGVDDYVPVVLPGATLPGDFQIAARKTYGHISNGMICSLRELGLGEDHDGIIVLQKSKWADDLPKLSLGDDVKELLGLNDELLEINITPDRGYCFSYRGIAREYAHSVQVKYTDLAIDLDDQAKKYAIENASAESFEVQIEDETPIHGVIGSSRFATLQVRGVDPAAQTPDWMVKRLVSMGMRSISLIVDVTNYVMLHFGQPLHAYDLNMLNAPIVVRRAKDGETIKTLDEQVRKLDVEDLLITDSKGGFGARAIGVAGVMGGFETEVTSTTTDVLLESAHFDPVSVARSSKRHKLPSEASHRFERGVDTNIQLAAGWYAANLLVELGGGEIFNGLGDINNTLPPTMIKLRSAQVTSLLGLDVPDVEIVRILEEIGCKVVDETKYFAVTPPTWRPDITIYEDLIEEVARLYGYDKIPSILPKASYVESPSFESLSQNRALRTLVCNTLASSGLVETLSYPFVGIADFGKLVGDEVAEIVASSAFEIANPIASNKPFMRTELLQTLLETASLNIRRQNSDVNIFELGNVTKVNPKHTDAPSLLGGKLPNDEQMKQLKGALPIDTLKFAAVLTSALNLDQTQADPWADALVIVKKIANLAHIDVQFINADPTKRNLPFHPGRFADIKAKRAKDGNVISIGYGGELSPKSIKNLGIPARSAAFEIDFDKLFSAMPEDPFNAARVFTFPQAHEDLAFVASKDVRIGDIAAAIRKSINADLLEDIKLFDIFTSEQLGADNISFTFAITLRSDHTLTADEILNARTKAIEAAKKLGAELRS